MLLDRAVVVITGAKGTGKTTAALTLARPSEMSRVYYDDAERSANRAVQEMQRHGIQFGVYNDLENRFADELPNDDDLLSRINAGNLPWTSEKERTALELYYMTVLELLDEKLERGQYDIYVHDTLGKLESGMAAWVEARRGTGKGKAGWTSKTYGRMWTQGVYPLYEAFITSILDRGVKTVILTSHLKTPWTDGKNAAPMINKVEPMGKKILYMLSTFMVWLIKDRRNLDGAPAALVLKERLIKMNIVKDRWVPQRMIPERIPHFAWYSGGEERDSVEWYLEHGCDLEHPREEERMSQGEREMISELMTSEQMKLMIALHEEDDGGNGVVVNVPSAPSVSSEPSTQVQGLMKKAREFGLDDTTATLAHLIEGFPAPLRVTGVAARLAAKAMERLVG